MLIDDPLAELLAWVRPRWHADAACREHPELNWFPERTDPKAAQRRVCAGCLVREECAAAGTAGKEHGIWGGQGVLGRRRARAGNGPHVGPRPETSERLEVIAAMRGSGASTEAIAARLGVSTNAVTALERRYRMTAA